MLNHQEYFLTTTSMSRIGIHKELDDLDNN
jgi:hypothetical protein